MLLNQIVSLVIMNLGSIPSYCIIDKNFQCFIVIENYLAS